MNHSYARLRKRSKEKPAERTYIVRLKIKPTSTVKKFLYKCPQRAILKKNTDL